MQDKTLNAKYGENRKRCGPYSYWHLGKDVGNRSDSIRLAFVGKTSWMDRSDIGECKCPIQDVSSGIDSFFGEDFRKYRYWRCIKEICQKVYQSENQSPFADNVFITNLAKCNIYKKQNTYVNVTDWTYFEQCVDIFETEIKLVKPTHVIFFTNTEYDPLIEQLTFGYRKDQIVDLPPMEKIKKIALKDETVTRNVCWWHRTFCQGEIPVMHFLRTRHPQGAPGLFEKAIIKWIQNYDLEK